MLDIKMDYRFGWRWLLPLVPRSRVLLLGFSEAEENFWRQALPGAEIVKKTDKASLWLINDLTFTSVAGIDTANPEQICLIGSRQDIAAWQDWLRERFNSINEFALLPSHQPRVVVPLGQSAFIAEALSLHRPGRKPAQVAIALLKILASFGVDRPLRQRMVCMASTASTFFPCGARQAGVDLASRNTPDSFALYLGTPDDNRKTVILPLGAKPRTILKHGASPNAMAALQNEARALETMRQTDLAAQVPELFDVIETDGRVTLHLEYRSRQRISDARFNQAGVKFLSTLAQQNLSQKPLAGLLTQTDAMGRKASRSVKKTDAALVRDHLNALAVSGAAVWGHRSHGDFAPWNCSWTKKGFFVFDWEASQPWDLALSDAFYLVTAPALHITGKHDPARVEANAFSMAEKVASAAGIAVEIDVYWGVWLLQRMRANFAPLYDHLLQRLAASWQ